MVLTVDIPDDLAGHLAADGVDLSRRALEALRPRRIQKRPSHGKWAASLAGRNSVQMSIMQAPDPIYLELVDFVAAGSTPEDVANFHPSPPRRRAPRRWWNANASPG